MNKNDLISELNSIKTVERIHRDKSARVVLDHQETFPFLLELLFKDQNRLHIKAAWIFELVCFENISLIVPYLSFYTQNLHKVHHESALRPIAKVCSFICMTYFTDKENVFHLKLSKEDMQFMVESNFDWLIEEHKVATKVFAMETLFFLGLEIDWVHDELKLVLEKNIIHSSAGYQSRARKILNKINTLKN